MKVIMAANNLLGLRALEHLTSIGVDVCALILHPPHRRKFGDELLRAAGLPDSRVFDGSTLDGDTLTRIQALGPDLCLSVLFGYIVRPPFISLFPKGVLNLHAGLLPYNRGANPNIWSIVEGTPAGTTLHYIDAGVDTGDIVAQSPVIVEPWDTGLSLYAKLDEASLSLLKDAWPSIERGDAPRRRQPAAGPGVTAHRVKDVEKIDRLDLDAPTTARRVIDILRARSFPPYRGAFFEVNGRKVYMRLELEPEGS